MEIKNVCKNQDNLKDEQRAIVLLDISIKHNNCFSVLTEEMRTSGQREYNRVPKQTSYDEHFVVVIQSFSYVQLLATPWTSACQASLSFTISWSLLKLVSIESVMPSNHLILCHPFSSCLQSFPASGSFQMSQLFASVG